MKSGFFVGLWAFGLACGVSAVSLPLWRALCRRWGHVDDPGHRKIHVQPIPLAGGLAVATGALLGGLLLWILQMSGVTGRVEIGSLGGETEGLRRLGVLVAGAVGMLVLGAWDDRRDLGAAAKFFGQGIIAVLVARWGVQVPVPDGFAIFGQVLTVFWIVAVTNAFNLSDNMNGLCAGLGLIGATAVSVFGIFAVADFAVLAWTWLMIAQGGDFLTRTLGLDGGLIAIRLISLAWLLVDLTKRHQLGALRVILLGLPALFLALAVSALFAFVHWLWFTASFALDVLR